MMKMKIGLENRRAGCTMMIQRMKMRRRMWIRLMWTLWIKISKLSLPNLRPLMIRRTVEMSIANILGSRITNRWTATKV
jgi:hypothetical protein